MTAAFLDRDAARRSHPGLLEVLAADGATRLVLVDAHGRVSLDAPAQRADLPQDGLTPTLGHPAGQALELAPVTAADLDLTGLET